MNCPFHGVINTTNLNCPICYQTGAYLPPRPEDTIMLRILTELQDIRLLLDKIHGGK